MYLVTQESGAASLSRDKQLSNSTLAITSVACSALSKLDVTTDMFRLNGAMRGCIVRPTQDADADVALTAISTLCRVMQQDRTCGTHPPMKDFGHKETDRLASPGTHGADRSDGLVGTLQHS